ncbi:MAG: squalene/phytoene synthase family protein [Planctomycetota bacterium]
MADLELLLVKTSRTFALAIPQLPEPTRGEVTIAYLLFRIADTFEDAVRWSAERKRGALEAFSTLLEPGSDGAARALARSWVEDPPLDHDGYLELLAETPAVLEALGAQRPGAQRIIRHHLRRTTEGMSRYAVQAGVAGRLELDSLDALRGYCHVVAGIVGEMLTELFVLGRENLAPVADYLQARARYFGEGLQLTNILKDSSGDATEGRSYVPASVGRARVFRLARSDLARAEEYVRALQEAGAPAGIVAFNALPVLLAWGTLKRVEAEGPGAKLARGEVARLVQDLHEALAQGEPAVAVASDPPS